MTEWLERHQVLLYLLSLIAGAGAGLFAPIISAPASLAIFPVLGVLLYATFLAVPFSKLTLAIRDWKFLTTLMGVNFVAVPLVVFVLSRIVAHDRALLVGVLIVLLAPCIDYVIVFAKLAGGAHDRLLAATPLLMLAQMLLLPVFVQILAGADVLAWVDPAPFVRAFVMFIVLPLGLAWGTQRLAARWRVWQALQHGVLAAMVPLMMLTLGLIVASQIAGVGGHIGRLLLVAPIFVAFAVVMVVIGVWVSRVVRLDVPSSRAVVFSGVTRNSLVVLPLVLALPAAFSLVPLVVVTQTLVELLVMVLLVRFLPTIRLAPPTPFTLGNTGTSTTTDISTENP